MNNKDLLDPDQLCDLLISRSLNIPLEPSGENGVEKASKSQLSDFNRLFSGDSGESHL